MARRPRSTAELELLDRAARVLPAGVRNATRSPEAAMIVRAARGSHIFDSSGNEYVDYLMGSGAILLGHAHPAVVEAVRGAMEDGSSHLMVGESAIRLAEEIVSAVACAEQVSFHSTGSEATLVAMRLARAYRRRDKILKFEGAFHGMSDWALMSNQWTKEPHPYPEAVANSAGIPTLVVHDVLVAPFNDLERTTAILDAHHDEIAGVIVEPMQRTIPPARGFLEGVREATRHHGIVLIFDEVVTGFRLAYGGAQAYYGVVPDLCALGKSISAGHPISAVCGRAEIMNLVDPSRRDAGAGTPIVAQTGTFSANPVSVAAALAVLVELRREGVYERLFATGRRLMEGLDTALAAAGIPSQVIGEPPVFEAWLSDQPVVDFRSALRADSALHDRFVALLLDAGIVKAHEKLFVSLAHDQADVERTIDAFHQAAASLAR